MASCRLLRPADGRTMPWKNGLGVTLEVARFPEGDGPFDWRVSLAQVTTDGPFSRFPGIDRILVPLDGDGIVLEDPVRGTATTLLPLEVARFGGDGETVGRLLGGPIRDFNVMTRRGRWTAEATVERGTGFTGGAEEARIRLVHVVAGSPTARCGREAFRVSAGETLLVVPPAAALQIDPGDGEGTWVRVEIARSEEPGRGW